MKSCIEWRKSFKYNPQIDEFNIDFKHKDKKLLEFLDIFAITQRVNIRLEPTATDNDIELIIAVWEMNKYNIAVCLNSYYDEQEIENNKYFYQLRQAGIPVYYSYLINDWDVLLGYLQLGVSDVFISGFLCFELDRVKEVVSQYKTQIRCYPNICQSLWNEGDTFKKFFIRPEDVYIYDEFIDVLEFYNCEDKQNVMFDIYFHDNKWVGDLREIIQGLRAPINNYYILGSEFASRRAICGKKCIKGKNCKLCDNLFELAQEIENNDEYEVFERNMRNGEGRTSEGTDIQ